VNSEETLREIASKISQCKMCELSFSRKHAVPGEGPSNAEIMFIGEGPGFHENEQGRPFVGQAGKFLDELLEKNGFKRKDVFITNVVKCRPPGNRDPQEVELTACADYLEQQVAAINPLVIITLGRFSMARYFNDAKISHIHGRSAWVRGKLIIPMYHPAAALHQPAIRPVIEKDFSQLAMLVEKARSAAAAHSEAANAEQEEKKDDATQLTFF
jgi:uracil-DNA glycosylase family 4